MIASMVCEFVCMYWIFWNILSSTRCSNLIDCLLEIRLWSRVCACTRVYVMCVKHIIVDSDTTRKRLPHYEVDFVDPGTLPKYESVLYSSALWRIFSIRWCCDRCAYIVHHGSKRSHKFGKLETGDREVLYVKTLGLKIRKIIAQAYTLCSTYSTQI